MENAESHRIKVEVAYAKPDKQLIVLLDVDKGCTLEEAVLLSRIQEEFPEIILADVSMGVFGKVEKHPESRMLKAGDRVEIYRPLIIDPKETRKKRAGKLKDKQDKS